MPLLTVSNLHHAYGSQVVMDGAGLTIEAGEKIGLVGRNGTGKTTLMKVIRGELKPDRGEAQVQRGARVGYLSQDPRFEADETLRGAAEAAFEQLHALHRRANDLYEQMASAEGAELDRLLRQQSRLDGEIEAAGGYAIDHRIDATLHGLGFTDDQFGLPVSALSGGQKGRLGLARLLLEAPDLLLLDEPTNHLDIVGRQWLETFLAEEYPGAVLVVSHDRWLLDRVVSRILEVEAGAIVDYPGSYDKYVELRLERQLTRARVHEKQMDHIRREKQFIARYRAGQRAKQARGRASRLERFRDEQLVERPPELEVMRLSLPPAPRSGDQVFSVEGLAKRYDDLVLFDDLSFSIVRGDRIGIIGPNGVGKTTLVRCLMGELEADGGSVRRGSRISVGYYRQLQEHLDLSLTVWQYLQTVIVGHDGQARASEQQARDLAGAFLFSGIEQDKALGDLSGGERSRAVLAGLVAGAHNLLILDEPTNHLDIPSAERLEQSLAAEGGYAGTLLLISHDRALLQATCGKLIVFEGDGRVRWFEGTYRDLLERSQRTDTAVDGSRGAAPAPPRQQRSAKPSRQAPARPASTAATNELGTLSVTKLEQRIESLDRQIAQIDQELMDPAVYSDGDRTRQLTRRRAELKAELEPVESEWAKRAEG